MWSFTKDSREGFENPLDALRKAKGNIVHFLGDFGNIAWEADAERALHEFAIWCAEEALSLVENPDPRSIEALRVKRLWLDRKASDEELDAASVAARTAASDAARAAARAAAWAAAWEAARVAARAAAWAVAWSAAWETQGKELERMLLTLQPEPPKRPDRYELLEKDWL